MKEKEYMTRQEYAENVRGASRVLLIDMLEQAWQGVEAHKPQMVRDYIQKFYDQLKVLDEVVPISEVTKGRLTNFATGLVYRSFTHKRVSKKDLVEL